MPLSTSEKNRANKKSLKANHDDEPVKSNPKDLPKEQNNSPIKPNKFMKKTKKQEINEEEPSDYEEITDVETDESSDNVSDDNTDDDTDDESTGKNLHENIKKMMSSDDEDSDALTTMNAIMEYNRMLVKRLEALESKTGGLKKGDIQNTVHDTMNEVAAKYHKEEEPSRTHHSFELPVGNTMKGIGSFSTSMANDKEDKTKHNDEESTVKDDDDEGKIRIGNGEKDDIVVKVEATKSGITFSIHIPRN